MATLNTTNIKHASSSSNNIVLASNGSVTIPTLTATNLTTNTSFGKLLQTIMVEKTDTASHNSGSTVQDVSGMSVNITPSASTSKILVNSTLQFCTQEGGYGFVFYLMRDSTHISRGDASGSYRTRGTFGNLSDMNNGYDLRPFTISYLDSPNTTSQITYKWRWNNPIHSSIMYINRPHGFADGAYAVMTSSNIIVQEIGA
tara:strand:+ start:629 stop:1231 length:603 start_codon:yes stop_codon:yes gene_type:complete